MPLQSTRKQINHKFPPLTLTFESLLGEPPQQSPAVFAEGGALVVVDLEPVGHVDLEALLVDLRHKTPHRTTSSPESGSAQRKPETLPVPKQRVAGLSIFFFTLLYILHEEAKREAVDKKKSARCSEPSGAQMSSTCIPELTIVSLLLMADPVHLARTLSMHFL